jgi:hypothetical protein
LENAKVIALTGNNAFSMSEHYVSVPEQGGGKPMGRMKLPESVIRFMQLIWRVCEKWKRRSIRIWMICLLQIHQSRS